jgi:zinc protease
MKTPALLLFSGALALAQVRLPDYSRDVLGNGVVVDVAVRRGVPLVSLVIAVKGGVESDPDAMGGLAATTAGLLRRGAGSRTAAQFEDELDSMGASFSEQADAQATLLSAEFLARHTGRALGLLADAVLRPSFPQDEVAKELAQRIERSKSLKDRPQAASRLYFQSFFYGPGHAYGHYSGGDEISLARINRAAIAAYHARMYVGRNLIVAASGDFDPAAMRAELARVFSRAQAGEAYAWAKEPAASAPGGGARLLLVDKPGSAQTYFWIGNRGITRPHPDRVPVWLVNTLFGGRFTSLLNEELRVNSGLTYGAQSLVAENRLTGPIALFSYTRTEATAKAIDLALDVVKRLREQGITAAQLASVKEYLKGTYPTERLETSDQVADSIAELEVFGIGRSDVDTLFARIDAVTLDEANAAARKYFGAGGLTFTLVGDAAKIRESARKYAPEIVELPISRPGFAAKGQ